MGNEGHAVTQVDWDRFNEQLRGLHKDWRYLHRLIEEYTGARFDRRSLEVAYLDVKGRISCDYTVLSEWRNYGCDLHAAIDSVFDRGTTLKSLAEDARNGAGGTAEDWQAVDEALGRIRQTLLDARDSAKPGKPIWLPRETFARHAARKELDDYARQFSAFRADWRRIYELVQASLQPDADRAALELELIQIKGKISCNYPVLPRWFGGRDEISSGIGRILSHGTSLEALAESVRNGGRMGLDWLAVENSAARTCQDLSRARAAMKNGKRTCAVDFLGPPAGPRWPIAKILVRTAVVCLVGFVLLTGYVMRSFLGFWAPDAGDGIARNASYDDREKVVSILAVMNEACVRADVDRFMTAIANDFRDDEGNGRRSLRLLLQAYNTAGNMQQTWVDWSRTNITREDDWLYATPVVFRSEAEEEGDTVVRLGLKQYGERWLVAFAEGYN